MSNYDNNCQQNINRFINNVILKGKELKIIVEKWLSKTGTPVLEFIAKSGIEQRTYYRLFEKKEVPQHYIDKLIVAGLTIVDKTDKNLLSSFVLQKNNSYNYTNNIQEPQKSYIRNENEKNLSNIEINNLHDALEEINRLNKLVSTLTNSNYTLIETNALLSSTLCTREISQTKQP